MIDHDQYRRALQSEPQSPDPELRAHRQACPQCSAYTERLLHFEARLQRALAIDLPSAARTRRALPRRAPTARWLALAASVLIAAAIAGVGWLAAPRSSLAAAVVAHMAGEPDAWRVSAMPVPDSRLSGVLQNANMRLLPSAGLVSYANSCTFRGHIVPHLAVQSPQGPVTVMVLVHETVHQPVQFDEQGYRGTIVPVPGHGSIAVLTRSAQTPRQIGEVAARVRDSVEWLP